MFLPDLLYVDERRLNDLLGRLGIPIEKLEKAKKVGLELSITGPTIGFEQSESRRPLDVHTRIELLEKTLTEQSRLTFSRPSMAGAVAGFVREDCPAVRVAVPATTPNGAALPAFSFWLCPENEQHGLLCLLEDCRMDDGETFNYSRHSTYTVMQSLAYYARREIDRSILAPLLPRVLPPRGEEPDNDHPPSLFYEFYSVQPYLNDFAKNPIPLMEKWKALVTPLRNIRTLYRVREYGTDAAHNFQKVTTFGYPLYIYNMGP